MQISAILAENGEWRIKAQLIEGKNGKWIIKIQTLAVENDERRAKV